MKIAAIIPILIIGLCSCRTVVRTSDVRTLRDSIRSIDILHDSIHIHDSVVILRKADTVTVREVRNLVRYRFKTDTVERLKRDTVYRTAWSSPVSSPGLFTSFRRNIVSDLLIMTIFLSIIVFFLKSKAP